MSDIDEVASSISLGTGIDNIASNAGQTERAKYFWLGKKFFASVVAEYMFSTSFSRPMPNLESCLQAYKRDFPWCDQLAFLRNKIVLVTKIGLDLNGLDDRKSYLVTIGMLVLKGDLGERDIVCSSIKNCMTRPQSDDMNVEGTRSNLGQSIPQPSNAPYAVAIKQYLDNTGQKLEYHEEPVALNPPRHKAELEVDGYTFVGVDKNKKQARHLAARAACKKLHVKIPSGLRIC